MQNPQAEIRDVVRGITEPDSAAVILHNVDRYFTRDAHIIHPMLNSPPSLGREGLKAAYKMLKVLTTNNKIFFHTVAFDDFEEGKRRQTCLLDMTEDIQLRFIPVFLRTVIHIRFFIVVKLVKESDGLWRIEEQIDNLPTDLGLALRGRLLGVVNIASDAVKQACGFGTYVVGSTLAKYNLL